MKAKLLNKSGKVYIFEFEGNAEIPEGDLNIEIKKWKNKRSLDANSYMWVLLQKQATFRNTRGMTVTNQDCYLESLKKYGQFTYIVLKPNAVEHFKSGWRECIELGEIEINGAKGIQLQCFFGSSTYDTIEFSALLNGIIEDCKDLGIETMTPIEVEKMMEVYKINYEKKDNSTTI